MRTSPASEAFYKGVIDRNARFRHTLIAHMIIEWISMLIAMNSNRQIMNFEQVCRPLNDKTKIIVHFLVNSEIQAMVEGEPPTPRRLFASLRLLVIDFGNLSEISDE